MQKWWWSSLLFMILGAAGLYLTFAQFQRARHVAPLRALLPDAGQEVCQVQPLVLLPQQPPRFFLDLNEPIVVRPDLDENVQPTGFTGPYAPLPQPPVTTRMPYADEIVPPAPMDTVLWEVLTEALQNLLTDPDASETVPAEETQEDAADQDFPRVGDAAAEPHMPLIPTNGDYHRDQMHCPHLHGPYPSFRR